MMHLCHHIDIPCIMQTCSVIPSLQLPLILCTSKNRASQDQPTISTCCYIYINFNKHLASSLINSYVYNYTYSYLIVTLQLQCCTRIVTCNSVVGLHRLALNCQPIRNRNQHSKQRVQLLLSACDPKIIILRSYPQRSHTAVSHSIK